MLLLVSVIVVVSFWAAAAASFVGSSWMISLVVSNGGLKEEEDDEQQTGQSTRPSFLSHLMHLSAIELYLKWWTADFLDPLQLWQAMNLAFPQQ